MPDCVCNPLLRSEMLYAIIQDLQSIALRLNCIYAQQSIGNLWRASDNSGVDRDEYSDVALPQSRFNRLAPMTA